MYTNWDDLKAACESCRKCELCKTRTNVVVGVGNPLAEVMFIGEGPGENEDLQGEPFVGRAGKLLDKMLDAVELDRHTNVYIANIVKCRPPQNRDPKPEEQEQCIEWLRAQVRLIRPKVIVCLGRIAAAKIIKPDIKITKERHPDDADAPSRRPPERSAQKARGVSGLPDAAGKIKRDWRIRLQLNAKNRRSCVGFFYSE